MTLRAAGAAAPVLAQEGFLIKEIFRQALGKEVLAPGFLRLVCEDLVTEGESPLLTPDEHKNLVGGIRSALREVAPSWERSFGGPPPKEIIRELACLYLDN